MSIGKHGNFVWGVKYAGCSVSLSARSGISTSPRIQLLQDLITPHEVLWGAPS